MSGKETRSDKYLSYLKNHPVLSVLIFIGVSFGAVVGLLESAGKLRGMLSSDKALIIAEKTEVNGSEINVVIRNVGKSATSLQYVEPVVVRRTSVPSCIALKSMLPTTAIYDFNLGGDKDKVSMVHDLQPQKADRIGISFSEKGGSCSAVYYYRMKLKLIYGKDKAEIFSPEVNIIAEPERKCVGIVLPNIKCFEKQKQARDELSSWWHAPRPAPEKQANL